MWGNIAIAFILAFIVSFMATPYTIKIANKIGAETVIVIGEDEIKTNKVKIKFMKEQKDEIEVELIAEKIAEVLENELF